MCSRFLVESRRGTLVSGNASVLVSSEMATPKLQADNKELCYQNATFLCGGTHRATVDGRLMPGVTRGRDGHMAISLHGNYNSQTMYRAGTVYSSCHRRYGQQLLMRCLSYWRALHHLLRDIGSMETPCCTVAEMTVVRRRECPCRLRGNTTTCTAVVDAAMAVFGREPSCCYIPGTFYYHTERTHRTHL